MKKVALVAALILATFVPGLFAQNHGEVGAFADYVRLHNADNANFWGAGGRLSVNVSPHVQLEGEMAYDFEKTIFNGSVTDVTGTITTYRSNLSLLSGLFGPKLQTTGPVRLFVTAKGGFLNFRGNSNVGSTLNGFTNSISNVTGGDTNGVFYPGGGIEAYLGPIGLRLDVGDLMYFDNGANHNLRVTFGPSFRF